MQNSLENLEKDVAEIKERNRKVEAEKAWEVSQFRILTIAGITYTIATFLLYLIGVQKPFLNSLIPTAGYYLSTRSLPSIKNWWIKKRSLKR